MEIGPNGEKRLDDPTARAVKIRQEIGRGD